MDLSQAQVDTFRRDGFLAIERVFSPPEMAVLEAALPEITDPSRGKVGFDEKSGLVRLSHGAHLYNEAFRRLSLHPRLVQPAQHLLDSEIHLWQSRLTIKPGLGAVHASGWAWHQDFSTWHVADGMPEPRAIVTFLFLDDVTASNAPVLVIPGSHHHGMLHDCGDKERKQGDYQIRGKNGEYQYMVIDPKLLREMAQRNGVVALTGPVGTVVFMNCVLVHGSTENISPLRRALFTLVFNPVDNRAQHPRPGYWVPSDVVPVRPLADDCLLTMAS
jgi:ectoine hydroxylase